MQVEDVTIISLKETKTYCGHLLVNQSGICVLIKKEISYFFWCMQNTWSIREFKTDIIKHIPHSKLKANEEPWTCFMVQYLDIIFTCSFRYEFHKWPT